MKAIYAALLLHKLGKAVDEKNLKHLITAAGSEADESEIKSLVASLKGIDIDKELENANLVSAAPASSGVVEAKKEEVHEEEKHEAAAEGLSALFG